MSKNKKHDIQLDFPEELKAKAAEREDMMLAIVASFPHSSHYRLAWGCASPMQIETIMEAINSGKGLQIFIPDEE